MSNLAFSHSGTFGDIIYALPIMKQLGGGDLYLRLHNMDNMAQRVLGAPNAGAHAGEMSQQQFDSLTPLIEQQPYVKSWKVWNGEHIDVAFEEYCLQIPRDQPGNYAFKYGLAAGVNFYENYEELMIRPWLDVKDPIKIPNRPIVINRISRHLYGCDPELKRWKKFIRTGLLATAVYVGLPQEHEWFQNILGVKIDYFPTSNILELARVIAGAEMFIGSQSLCLSLALGLGKTIYCEGRRDVRPGRNECFYIRPNVFYF